IRGAETPAGAREAARLRLRPGREAAGAKDGDCDPVVGRPADAVACVGCARRRHLPRARAAIAEDCRVIARLRGRPVANTPEGLVVDVGGVGYLVAATPSAVRLADRRVGVSPPP